MAITNSDLLITIAADSSKAVQSLEGVVDELKAMGNQLGKTADGMGQVEEATTGLGASALKLNAAIEIAQKAFAAFKTVISSTVGEYILAEEATEKLRGTLRIIGSTDIDNVVDGFNAFADSLQATTNVSAESVLKYVSMAKALRLTDDRTRALITTAQDLGNAFGKDIGETFKALTTSLKGDSRALTALAPELKNLTEEEFRQGRAIDLLAKKYAGFGEAATRTIGGQLTQVTLRYGDVLEEVGGVFQDVFRFDDQRIAIAALAAIKDAISGIRPVAKEMGDALGEIGVRVATAFDKIADKATAVATAFGILGAALALAFAPAIITAITALATTLGVAAGAAALLAAKVAIITAGVAAYAGAIEIVIRNLGQLDKVGVVVINGLILGFRRAKDFAVETAGQMLEAFVRVAKSIGELFSLENLKAAFSGGGPGIFDRVAASAKAAFGQIGKDSAVLSTELKSALGDLDLGFTGKAITAGKEFAAGLTGDIAKVEVAQVKLNQATNDYQAKALPAAVKSGSDAFGKLMDATRKLEEDTAKIGSSAAVSLGQVRDARLKEIATVEDELKKTGDLTAKTEELERARRAVATAFNAGILSEQQRTLEDVVKSNQGLADKLAASGKTQVEQIDLRLKRELEILETKRQQLQTDGLLAGVEGEKLDAALKAQKALLQAGANQDKAKAPPALGESFKMSGEALGKGITDAMSPLTGITDGIKAAVGALSAVVGAIPDTLNMMSDLVDKIIDLPDAILSAVDRLAAALLRFVSEFIPRLLEVIPELLNVADLPGMLSTMIDALPDIVEDLVRGLTEAMPEIALAFTEFLITDGPRIAIKIAEVLAIRLPLAILKGIGGAISNISKMIQSLFKGGLKFDVKDAGKKLTDVAKKFAGSASRIFEVKDLVEGAKSTELAKGLAASIDGGARRAKTMMESAWDKLRMIGGWLADLWKGVWGVLEKIGGALALAWKAVWGFLQEVGSALAELWKGVWVFLQQIGQALAQLWRGVWGVLLDIGHAVGRVFLAAWEGLQRVGGALAEVWQRVWGVLLEIGHAVGGLFMRAWEGLQQIGGALAEGFKAAWEKLKELAEPLINAFKEAWEKLKELAGNAVEAFKEAFNRLKEVVTDLAAKVVGPLKEAGGKGADAFKNAMQNAGDVFGGIGTKIWEGLKRGLLGIGDVIKDQLGGINPAGLFEKIFRIPPGETKVGNGGTVENILGINLPYVNFARGGKVPGRAAVPGDSELNDRIVALLSPGEAVISRTMMGNPGVRSIVDSIMNGSYKPPGYAYGGSIKAPKLGGTVGKIVSGDINGALSDVRYLNAQEINKNLQRAVDTIGQTLATLDPATTLERVGQAVMKMFAKNKFHDGGPVGDIPATLQSGEFVMSRRGVQAAGLGALQAMNSGSAAASPVITNNIELILTVNADSFDDAYVRTKLMPTIRNELRKASQKGDPLISIRGVYDA